ncbi:hypothetical protein ACG83_08880 [Frankia sp. R43]|uniref:Fur family transcriptional regulator n=1 Tax=Frankia sp. R43 TaxID=269536 RepID=UPI0006D9D1CE|nr:transcriptional repressor [Frankia sp. R43]KPM55450.1 hypothetical protein ACG83_08880 [Frankia sp. R43]
MTGRHPVRVAPHPTSPPAGKPAGRAQAGVAELRSRGGRVARARRAILEVLAGTSEHLGIDELFRRAVATAPGLHLTTVYRAVERLEELGLVVQVHGDRGAAFFHLSEVVAGQSHLHVRCRVCERVFDVPAGLLDEAARRLDESAGFLLTPEHTALARTCRWCRAPRDLFVDELLSAPPTAAARKG